MTISPEAKSLKPRTYRPRYSDGCDDDGYLMSDGKPMAESVKHRDTMFYAISALQSYFGDRPDIYVSGNDFVHFVEGNRKSYLSPDTYVVFGVDNRKDRDNFKTWEEGANPAVVFEFTSKETKNVDLNKKRTTYEQIMRVSEYFLFDPKGEYLKPRLRGMRLEQGRYRDLELNTENRLYSEELNLFLGYEGEEFRFYQPITGVALLSPKETTEALKTELERAERAEQSFLVERERAEAEMAQLRAEIQALKQSREQSS